MKFNVHRDQMGFIHNRAMYSNTHKTVNIHYCTTQKIPTLLYSVDIQNIFDSVEIHYLHSF